MPTIVPNQSFEAYQAAPGLNFSTLKALQISDRAFVHARTAKAEPTDDMDLGTALHTKLLEPTVYHDRFAIWYGGRRAGKEWDAFVADNECKTILKADDHRQVEAWADMCDADPIVGAELRRIHQAELTVTWTDPATKQLCKARIDGASDKAIIDIKTTAKPTPEEFERDAFNRLYPAQLAYYLDGLTQGAPGWTVKIICIYKGDARGQYPPDCWVMELTEEVLAHGRSLYRDWLERAAVIAATGQAHGVGKGRIQYMTLPAWAESQLPMPSITDGDGEPILM